MADLDFDVDLDADLGELRAFVRGLKDAQRELKGLDRGSSRGLRGMDSNIMGAAGAGAFFGTVLGSVASKALELGLALARVGAEAALAFGKAVLDAALFRETSVGAFRAMSRGSSDGVKEFEHVRDLAIEFGADMRDVTAQFLALRRMGFAMGDAERLFKRFQDLRTLGVSSDQISRAVTAITQIKGTGKLQGDELMQLAEAGVSIDQIYQALGKRLGKTVPEIIKLKEAGKIGAADAIAAIEEAMGEMAGGKEAGALGKDFADKTVAGLIQRIKNAGSFLTDEIAKRIDISELKPILDDITGFLKSPEAGAIFDSIANGFKMILGAVRDAWPFVKQFLSSFKGGFGEGFDAAWSSIKPVLDGLKTAFGDDSATQMKNIALFARMAGAAIGFLVAQAIGMVMIAARIVQGISLVTGKIRELITSVTTGGSSLGDGLIAGFVSGITAGAQRVVAAVKGVATSALASAKAALGIASPSKEFSWMGEMTSLGFAQGVDFNAPAANDSLTSMVAPPAVPSLAGLAGGGRGGAPNVSVTVTIQGGTNMGPSEVEAAVRRGVEQALDEYAA